MSSTFHDAQKSIQESQVASLLHRATPAGKDGFNWKDPLRDFESLGQFVPSELRYWLGLSVQDRLAFLDRYDANKLPNESPDAWVNRLRFVWRDVAFIVGEELKCWARPELVVKGSREVIKKALGILIPAEPEEKKPARTK